MPDPIIGLRVFFERQFKIDKHNTKNTDKTIGQNNRPEI